MRDPASADQLDPAIAAVAGEFHPAGSYLNTATIGLPHRRAVDAVRVALDRWQVGAAVPHDFDQAVERSRRLYAELTRTSTDRVSVGSQASVYAGLVAASVPDGAGVLTARGDFTGVLFGVPGPGRARGAGTRGRPG